MTVRAEAEDESEPSLLNREGKRLLDELLYLAPTNLCWDEAHIREGISDRCRKEFVRRAKHLEGVHVSLTAFVYDELHQGFAFNSGRSKDVRVSRLRRPRRCHRGLLNLKHKERLVSG
jgi:hypothetical protein